jgi:Tfp pilus assembly PilM family ATPase
MVQLLEKIRSRAGLDIGDHSVKAVRLSRAARGWRLTGCASFPRAHPHVAPSAEELAQIARVLHRQGFAGAEFTLAAPSAKLRTGVLELPLRAPGVPIDQIARAEFARVHKCDPSRLELAYWELPTPARAAKATHVMAAGILHSDAEPWLESLDTAGLNVRAVDTHASAIARACLQLAQDSPGAKGSTIAALDLGSGAAVLAIVKNSVVIYERRIAEGGLRELHQTVSRHFNVSPEVAEFILHEVGIRSTLKPAVSDSKATSEPNTRAFERFREAGDLIIDRFVPLIAELRLAFSYAQHQYADAPLELVLVAGGGACIPGICEHFSGALGIDVRPAAPQAAIECVAEVQARLSPAYMPAVGLAMFEVGQL